jgi:hypothetical protein
MLQDQLQVRDACRVPFGSNCSSTNTSSFRAFQYFFSQMDRNSAPLWVKISMRSLHIPAPVYKDKSEAVNAQHLLQRTTAFGRRGTENRSFAVAVTSTCEQGLQTEQSAQCRRCHTVLSTHQATRNAAHLVCTSHNLKKKCRCGAVRDDEGIKREGNATDTAAADYGWL